MPDTGPHKILIIDDDQANRYTLSRILSRKTWHLLEAGTGQEALDLARSERPDLILLDVRLPDLSGYEVCRQLKADPVTTHIPVIQTSANFTQPEHQARGLEGGADSFLVQPIEPSVLVATMNALLRNRRIMRELQIQRDLIRTIADNAASGLFLLDQQGRPTFMNPAAEKMLGYRLEELENAPLHDQLHHQRPDGTPYPAVECPLASQLTTKKPFHGEETFIRKCGGFFPVAYTLAPLRSDAGPAGCVLEFRDITEQVRLRNAAEEQRKWLESVLDLLPIPIMMNEVGTGRLLFVNKAAERMLEWRPSDETDGGDYRDRFHLTDLQGKRLRSEEFPSLRAARGEKLDGLEVILHQAPRKRHLVLRSETLPKMHGQGSVIVISFQEITAIKETEEQLNQALRIRDEFISIASHELKTPLTGLRLQLQLMERLAKKNGSGTLSPEELSRSLPTAISQADRLSHMLDRLLDLSRIRENRLHLELNALDLCSLAQEVAHRLRDQATTAGSELWVEHCDPLIVYADPFRIEQAITNLITNAIKYGAGKPIRVSLKQEDGGQTAALGVQDQGIGISEADQSRIFSRFERATDARRAESLGLGLFITRQIVEAHGGRISVDSRPNQGSLFTVRLPIRQMPAGTA